MEYTISEGNYKKFGIQIEKDGIIFTFAGEKEDTCFLLFYDEKGNITKKIRVPDEYCMGSVRSVYLHGIRERHLRYNYEINGNVIPDVYAEKIVGREKWNDEKRENRDYQICCGYEDSDFDWEGDTFPEISRSEMVMYKLHVRGFSMDAGIRGKERGTFLAIKNKIPYLKKLGVTTIELMPVYEFEEIIVEEKEKLPDYLVWESREDDLIKKEEKPEKKGLNYWGYTAGNYFAVKASYSFDKNASKEFKSLIRELHKNNMECVMEMYFENHMNQNVILDALRFWVREYHVDGFHLLKDAVPVTAIAQDLFLHRTKIFYQYIDVSLCEEAARYPHLFIYNDEYLYTARKLLNHAGGTIKEFGDQQKKQHELLGFVNYITNNNGFTMNDLFSYQEKHNEENGESNSDGNDWNFSDNCGAEGRTGRRYVTELRKKQICNAFCMLLTGQGVPLLLAGDEFGNSQRGNNNAYCQDNRIGWLNWKLGERYQWLTEFVTKLLAFRKEHPVLSLEKPMQMNDYKHKGAPDLSYHGENAWISAFPESQKAVGMMYCGAYAQKEDGTADDDIYVGYNFMHGICHLALPKLPDKKKWYLVMDTSLVEHSFLQEKQCLENQHLIALKPQSSVLLIGRTEEDKPSKKKEKISFGKK